MSAGAGRLAAVQIPSPASGGEITGVIGDGDIDGGDGVGMTMGRCGSLGGTPTFRCGAGVNGDDDTAPAAGVPPTATLGAERWTDG